MIIIIIISFVHAVVFQRSTSTWGSCWSLGNSTPTTQTRRTRGATRKNTPPRKRRTKMLFSAPPPPLPPPQLPPSSWFHAGLFHCLQQKVFCKLNLFWCLVNREIDSMVFFFSWLMLWMFLLILRTQWCDWPCVCDCVQGYLSLSLWMCVCVCNVFMRVQLTEEVMKRWNHCWCSFQRCHLWDSEFVKWIWKVCLID